MSDLTQTPFQLWKGILMIKSVYALAALGMVVAPVSASVASPLQDGIDALFQKATDAFKEKGFVPTGWQQRGSLKQGAETSFTVTLKAGNQALVGLCDDNCSNIDMFVSKGGAEVDKDVEDDDYPIVIVAEPGTYTVRIAMKACSASTCAIGVKGYQQQ